MMNVEFASKFYFANPAVTTLVAVALSSGTRLLLPVWPIVAKPSASPEAALAAGEVSGDVVRYPFVLALLAAKVILSFRQPNAARLALYGLTALIARLDHWRHPRRIIASGVGAVANVPFPAALDAAKIMTISFQFFGAILAKFHTTLITLHCQVVFPSWVILAAIVLALPYSEALSATKLMLLLAGVMLVSFKLLAALSALDNDLGRCFPCPKAVHITEQPIYRFTLGVRRSFCHLLTAVGAGYPNLLVGCLPSAPTGHTAEVFAGFCRCSLRLRALKSPLAVAARQGYSSSFSHKKNLLLAVDQVLVEGTRALTGGAKHNITQPPIGQHIRTLDAFNYSTNILFCALQSFKREVQLCRR